MKRKHKLPATPILNGLIEAGIVRIERTGAMIEVIGRAADGVEVGLGCYGHALAEQAKGGAQVERYLEQHPTPDTW